MSHATGLGAQLDRRRGQLGMSRQALARFANLSVPTVNRILSGKELNPQIQSLVAIARVLRVAVTFGAASRVEPVEDAFEIRKQRATEKAQRVIQMVQGTMGLEAQAVGPAAQQQMLEQTVCELLAGPARRLWSE